MPCENKANTRNHDIIGINAASEIFQNWIADLLTGLRGWKNIWVYGRDVREHDENLNCVLACLREHNARLNRDKSAFRKAEVIFYGHSFSAEGIKAAPQKINAIKTMQPPESPSEVKSLLGMAQYVSRFISNYFTITAPLRALTHQSSNIGTVQPPFLRVRKGAEGALINIYTNEGA